MIVMKFGGNSISTISQIHNVINIIAQRIELKPVIVVSAIGKTTRKLQTMAEEAALGNSKGSLKLFGQLERVHKDLLRQVGANNTDCLQRQERYFSELKLTLQLISNRKKLSGLLKDKVLSFGELLSTNLMYAALIDHGLNPKLLDARICVITDDHFTHAHLYEDESMEKIRDYMTPVLKENYLPIIQGYIGSSKSGAVTTLGFEGSDYTAVIIGVALHVENVQIWKDVAGVMTADPMILRNARPIKNMSFDEAEELALCGAKILHPKTINPARKSGTKISIYNTREPNEPPTLIQREIIADDRLPKSITSRNNLCVLKIHSNSIFNDFEFYKHVFDTIHLFELSPIYIQGRYEFIFLIVGYSSALPEFEKKLSTMSTILTEKNVASISVIGYNITQNKLLHNNISGIFDKDVLRYSLTESRNHSLTFVISGNDLDNVCQKIHDEFVIK
jgi:aspartate kinase